MFSIKTSATINPGSLRTLTALELLERPVYVTGLSTGCCGLD
ncbi:MAG: hypothetical protein ACXWCX_10915 [Burkholderiales bacterium]